MGLSVPAMAFDRSMAQILRDPPLKIKVSPTYVVPSYAPRLCALVLYLKTAPIPMVAPLFSFQIYIQKALIFDPIRARAMLYKLRISLLRLTISFHTTC
ncbi:unnamed protein product [Danaus chrysippus]|uniref:(African queen) hypothetical protein n=1 Tax=Danaus chrysippus TaxID=151541 RepID=A0A8J2QVX9_9NEOP|nr:unnamed protein product [Danaus chrysippus]